MAAIAVVLWRIPSLDLLAPERQPEKSEKQQRSDRARNDALQKGAVRRPDLRFGHEDHADMDGPTLKQFGDLSREDFEVHPVWVACHTMDYGAPWYDNTNEENFRPWVDSLPVGPGDGMFLVRAAVMFADGSHAEGFLTPAFEAGDIGTIQPYVFVGDRAFGFWGGMFGVPPEVQSRFLDMIAKSPDQIFPIHFHGQPGLSKGVVDAEVRSWLKMSHMG